MIALMGIRWLPIMKKERLSLRVSVVRLEKLRRIAEQREKTMTQMVEDWIDRLQEERPHS